MLTVHDGNQLGASFLKFLSFAATEEGAFASWAKKYPAMNELSLSPNYKFFKPLMLTLGKATRTSANWQKLGLSIGASLMSMLDVATDIYTIIFYHSLGKHSSADLMTMYVVLSLALQLIITNIIHSRNKKQMLVELFATVTYTKSGINYWRLYTNAKQYGHEMVPPVTELMMFHVCEVFAESIPMGVIQLQNLLALKEANWIVVGALISSTCFVSYCVSFMTYMKDIDEDSR